MFRSGASAMLRFRPNRVVPGVLWLLWWSAAALPQPVAADAALPVPRLPEQFRWEAAPPVPGLRFAWVEGSERAAGPYVLRVQLAAGTQVPPHTHPDARTTTVLIGILYVGFGTEFDADRLVAVPAGAVYVTPSNTPHFLWAKDNETVYQESGIGPTATGIIKRK